MVRQQAAEAAVEVAKVLALGEETPKERVSKLVTPCRTCLKRLATHILIAWTAMDCSHDRRRILGTPGRLWEVIRFLCVFFEEMSDRTRDLLDLPRGIKQFHLVVLLAYLVRQAAGPCFDLVEFVLFFIVSGFAHINLFVKR